MENSPLQSIPDLKPILIENFETLSGKLYKLQDTKFKNRAQLVHQLRVLGRKNQALFALISGQVEKATLNELALLNQKIHSFLSPMRDWDVVLGLIQNLKDFPHSPKKMSEFLFKKAKRKSKKKIHSNKLEKMASLSLKLVEKILKKEDPAPLGTEEFVLLVEEAKTNYKIASKDPKQKNIHQYRKSVKKSLYALKTLSDQGLFQSVHHLEMLQKEDIILSAYLDLNLLYETVCHLPYNKFGKKLAKVGHLLEKYLSKKVKLQHIDCVKHLRENSIAFMGLGEILVTKKSQKTGTHKPKLTQLTQDSAA